MTIHREFEPLMKRLQLLYKKLGIPGDVLAEYDNGSVRPVLAEDGSISPMWHDYVPTGVAVTRLRPMCDSLNSAYTFTIGRDGNYLTTDLPVGCPRFLVMSYGVSGQLIEGWANTEQDAVGAWHAVASRYVEDGMMSASDRHVSTDRPVLIDSEPPADNGEQHPLGHSEFDFRLVLVDVYKVTNARPESWMWRDELEHARCAIRDLVDMLHEIDHHPMTGESYVNTDDAKAAVQAATYNENYTDVFPFGTCDECGSAVNEDDECVSDDTHETGVQNVEHCTRCKSVLDDDGACLADATHKCGVPMHPDDPESIECDLYPGSADHETGQHMRHGRDGGCTHEWEVKA